MRICAPSEGPTLKQLGWFGVHLTKTKHIVCFKLPEIILRDWSLNAEIYRNI